MKKFGMTFFIVNALIAYLFAVLVYIEVLPVTREIVTMLLVVVGSCFLSFSANIGEDK
ncbi:MULTISPECIES: hypothetical protein [Bacillus]|uniref:hypothetical protein n=1 Tax=Bacillus TaxID=1386 RepID=UPI00159BA86C|nr:MULTISPECIES: hypothetical protein [Bacillus]MBY7125180.1 hypothetical protein [Bacillus sp. 16GRE42]MCR6850160.1 hypothetical protein [Bacillus sp. IBL03825]